MKTIFIQIAAYRDPELVPTLRSCFENAAHPDRIRVGICWQRDEADSLREFCNDERIEVIEVPYSRGRGACWARHLTQKLYKNEDYTLQIDSHHRFTQSWDTIAIKMIEDLQAKGIQKPLLTCYAPIYDPDNDPNGRANVPLRLCFSHFTEDGPFYVMPETMDNYQELTQPEPARFLSGHFIFTLGIFCFDVPYNPNLYFFGEEPSMAVRSFTSGYDLFHPHIILVWHYYGRDNDRRHWDDNKHWTFRNQRSLNHYLRSYEIISENTTTDIYPYGLGTSRTLLQYELYTGVCITIRKVTSDALSRNPPNYQLSHKSIKGFYDDLHTSHSLIIPFPNELESIQHYDFIYIGAHGANGEELIRRDLYGQDMNNFRRHGSMLLCFCSVSYPSSYTIWPHVTSLGWSEDKITVLL
jgi:Glycosyltransferase (GlcNAc)